MLRSEVASVWRTAKLGEITRIGSRNVDPSDQPALQWNYVGLENIESGSGRLVEFEPTLGREIGSAKASFRKGDVLYGKLRPYLRKAWVAQFDGCSSTDLIPLTPGPELDPAYLKWFLLSPLHMEYITPLMAGIRMPRLRSEDLYNMPIPLPSIAEQRRIVNQIEELMSRVHMVVLSVQEAYQLASAQYSAFLTACFSGTFLRGTVPIAVRAPDEGVYRGVQEIPEHWAWISLNRLGTIQRGRSKHRPRNDPSLFGGTVPFVQTGDVANAGLYLTQARQFYSEVGLAQSRLFKSGTVCVTIAANIGETAILGTDACFPDSVVGIQVEHPYVTPEYLRFYLETIKEQLLRDAPATAQKNINLDTLARIEVPVPPKQEFDRLNERLLSGWQILESLKARSQVALEDIGKFQHCVLDLAFKGSL